MPAAAGADTRDWLSKGLIEGRANDVSLVVKGDLDKFPFVARKGEKQDGVFRITGKVTQAKLLPAPDMLAADHRTPLWPRIDDIDGHLTLDRNRLQIHADSARTAGIPLSAVDVVIPDFMANNPVLDVNGSASGSLQAMLAYVNSTPIVDWIDGLTDEVRTLGNARVALKMQVPLGDGQPTVQGSVKFAGNEIQMWRALPAVQQVNGELAFSDKGVQLNNVQGNVLGGPLVLSGGVQRDGSTLVKLDGAVTADGIARYLTAPSAKKLMRKVTGTTRYSGMVRVRNQRPEIAVESSLAGMGIDMPAPLQKAASDTMPLKVTVMPVGLNDQQNLNEEIRVNLGRAVSARYLRQRPIASPSAPWKLVRGGIGVNAPPPVVPSAD